MSQNAFFPWTCNLLVSQKTMQRHFSPTLHHLSQVIFATATVVAFVPLRSSRFNFHCYTQREATPTQKSARKWRCDLLRLLARKITKGIHSCTPASLNRPKGKNALWTSHTAWLKISTKIFTLAHCLNLLSAKHHASICKIFILVVVWSINWHDSCTGKCQQLSTPTVYSHI